MEKTDRPTHFLGSQSILGWFLCSKKVTKSLQALLNKQPDKWKWWGAIGVHWLINLCQTVTIYQLIRFCPPSFQSEHLAPSLNGWKHVNGALLAFFLLQLMILWNSRCIWAFSYQMKTSKNILPSYKSYINMRWQDFFFLNQISWRIWVVPL